MFRWGISLVLFVFLGSAAFAQHLSVGIIGGVPFTDLTKAPSSGTLTYFRDSGRYTIGPTLQIALPLSLRIELDALYRPLGYRLQATGFSDTTSASQWRFPLLLQYRFSAPLIKPYVEAGVSFDHLSNLKQSIVNPSTFPSTVVQRSHSGLILGVGVDLKLPFVRVSPELRYTRQGSEDIRNLSELNQAEFLVGFRF